ncbi:MAG: NAD(P)H-dependent oxidoreductase [Minisyncoccia bacterium]|jgi:nitroreductase
MDDYLNNLMWRYATKKFDPQKKLSVAETDLLEETLRLAPSSFGFQLWKFYRIDDPAMRSAIKDAAYGQAQVADASHLYALASKIAPTEQDVTDLIESIKAGRGATDESLAGYKKALEGAIAARSGGDSASWTAKQVYIALGFILDAAAQHHIDACPMEGFDHNKVSEIVGATKEGYAVNVLCPVGHRSADDGHAGEKKVRYPKEKVIKVI